MKLLYRASSAVSQKPELKARRLNLLHVKNQKKRRHSALTIVPLPLYNFYPVLIHYLLNIQLEENKQSSLKKKKKKNWSILTEG